MGSRTVMAQAIVLLFTLPACDRFAHPRYDPPQYTSNSGGFGGGGSVSTSVAGPGDDITVPGCGVVAGGVGGGGEGARCTAANDCAIVCCSCNGSASGGEWSAASCVGGFCAGQPTTCGRTSACGSGGVVVVGAPAPDACGGGSYADPTCDACMRASCCLEEAACASDGSCGAVDACAQQCSDSACVASCQASYGSSNAAANLDACFAASCVNACP